MHLEHVGSVTLYESIPARIINQLIRIVYAIKAALAQLFVRSRHPIGFRIDKGSAHLPVVGEPFFQSNEQTSVSLFDIVQIHQGEEIITRVSRLVPYLYILSSILVKVIHQLVFCRSVPPGHEILSVFIDEGYFQAEIRKKLTADAHRKLLAKAGFDIISYT